MEFHFVCKGADIGVNVNTSSPSIRAISKTTTVGMTMNDDNGAGWQHDGAG